MVVPGGSGTTLIRSAVSHGAAAAIHDVVELLPEHVDGLEAGGAQEVELAGQRDDVAHVVLVVPLLVRGAVVPLVRGGGVPAVINPPPGLLDHGVGGGDRVVIQEPAPGHQPRADFGEQLLLAPVGQVVHAQGGDN